MLSMMRHNPARRFEPHATQLRAIARRQPGLCAQHSAQYPLPRLSNSRGDLGWRCRLGRGSAQLARLNCSGTTVCLLASKQIIKGSHYARTEIITVVKQTNTTLKN